MIVVRSTWHQNRWRTLFWATLLAGGQLADLLTTQMDMANGAVEGNRMAGELMSMGGLGLLSLVKLLLVGAMVLAVVLVDAYSAEHPGIRSRMARTLVWRGLQVCVIVLVATALHNVAVLAQIQGWLPAAAIASWPLTG